MSERASESVSQRSRAEISDHGPTERSEGVHMSELAGESVSQRSREAPTERSEGVR